MAGAALITLSACGEERAPPLASIAQGGAPALGGASGTGRCPYSGERRVLFIGNSYTFYHDMPETVGALATDAGCNLSVSSTSEGGIGLAEHTTRSATSDAIKTQLWTNVILQDQSQRPGLRPSDVRDQGAPHAITLVDSIKAQSPFSEITYYVTWGRRDGDGANCDYYDLVCTFDGHTNALAEGYGIYREATGGTLAPVGFAFQLVVHDDDAPFDSDLLWDADGSHPTPRGTYLAAAVFFYHLVGSGAETPDYTAGLSSQDAQYLLGVAHAVIEGERADLKAP
jgi:hypothetical protein